MSRPIDRFIGFTVMAGISLFFLFLLGLVIIVSLVIAKLAGW